MVGRKTQGHRPSSMSLMPQVDDSTLNPSSSTPPTSPVENDTTSSGATTWENDGSQLVTLLCHCFARVKSLLANESMAKGKARAQSSADKNKSAAENGSGGAADKQPRSPGKRFPSPPRKRGQNETSAAHQRSTIISQSFINGDDNATSAKGKTSLAVLRLNHHRQIHLLKMKPQHQHLLCHPVLRVVCRVQCNSVLGHLKMVKLQGGKSAVGGKVICFQMMS